MTVSNEHLTFSTGGEVDFVDPTSKIEEVVEKSTVKNGTVHVFAFHTTVVIFLIEFEPRLFSGIKPLRKNYSGK